MRTSESPFQRFVEILLSLCVLGLILAYSYAQFFDVPYAGFYFNPSTGEVIEVYLPAESFPIKTGDVIRNIGGISWEDYQSDGTVIFYENAQAGDNVEIAVLRGGAETTVFLTFPGFNPKQFQARFFNIWWLAYVFWVFGVLTQTIIRPRDTRWWLMSLANYLTGLWVILGSVSASQVWGSSLLLHAVTWLLVPVYLHFHWLFPRPLKGMPGWAWTVVYLAGAALAAGELTQILSRTVYATGFLLMVLGIVALLIAHAVRQPAQRREVGLLGISILLALTPAIILGVAGISNHIPQIGPLALLALPVVPAAYFLAVYRQQLGGLEVRANRLLSIYAFLILLGALLLLLFAPAAQTSLPTETLIVLTLAASLVTAYVSLAVFPAFQSFLEKRLLGIRLPYQRLPETYSSRIAASASMAELLKLLEEEVFPSLLVRQFAFLQWSGDTGNALLVKGIEADQLPGKNEMNALIVRAGRYLPLDNSSPRPWIRLILTLKLGGNVSGLWLLGRRDPDDAYHEAEIPILQSLADQTATAASNLLHAERIRTLYQLDIDRHEQDRLRLALDLHDSVLNQLAALRMNADDPNLSSNFQRTYDQVAQRLREIVSDLRPPMLNYGLKLALEELVQDLTERSGDGAKVTLSMQAADERYPQNVETHLFRIVQEACENALRHANATQVNVSARLEPDNVSLSIEDDGRGFALGERLELDDLLVNKHFGLAGMAERASLIGAKASIHSGPQTGTRIQIVWPAPPESPA